MILLLSKYRQKIECKKPVSRQRKVLDYDSTEYLGECFDCTNQYVLTKDCDYMDDLYFTVTSYMRFRTDDIIQTRSVKIFSDNEPWISKDLKENLNRKQVTKRYWYVQLFDIYI